MHYGIYILSESKIIMNDLIYQLGGHKEEIVMYTDTDSVYIKNKYFKRLDGGLDSKGNKLMSNELGAFKNDYGEGKYIENFISLGPKIKYSMLNSGKEIFTWKGMCGRKLTKQMYEETMKNGQCVEKMIINQWNKSIESGVDTRSSIEKAIGNRMFLSRKCDKVGDGYTHLVDGCSWYNIKSE